MRHDPNCIFCKIVEGQIPSRKVYEDDEILAFHDIHPWAPVHFLLIPKVHIPSMAHVEEQHAPVLGKLMALVPRLASQEGCRPYPEGGFRVVCNTGADGGQEHRAHRGGVRGPQDLGDVHHPRAHDELVDRGEGRCRGPDHELCLSLLDPPGVRLRRAHVRSGDRRMHRSDPAITGLRQGLHERVGEGIVVVRRTEDRRHHVWRAVT